MCSSSSHHGYLVAAICWPPASLVIILPVEPSSPQGREDKEVPMSSCPAPVYVSCVSTFRMTMKWYWTSRSQGGGGRWWRWQTGETPTNKVQKDKTCVKLIFAFTSHPFFSLEPVFKQSIIVIAVSAMGESQIETGCLMSLSTSGKGLASVQSLVQVLNFTAY